MLTDVTHGPLKFNTAVTPYQYLPPEETEPLPSLQDIPEKSPLDNDSELDVLSNAAVHSTIPGPSNRAESPAGSVHRNSRREIPHPISEDRKSPEITETSPAAALHPRPPPPSQDEVGRDQGAQPAAPVRTVVRQFEDSGARFEPPVEYIDVPPAYTDL